MIETQYASYKLENFNGLKMFCKYSPQWININKDIDKLEYYCTVGIGFSNFDKTEFIKCAGTEYKYCAITIHGQIAALGASILMGKNNWEVGAISTNINYRNRGMSKCVCSFIAKYILENKKIATLNTGLDNFPMQNVAEQIGMKRV